MTCQNPECGKVFTPKTGVARFCCTACAGRARRLSHLILIPCDGPGCTTALPRTKPSSKAHNFCSRACHIAWRQANRTPRICDFCGKEYLAHYTKTDQRCCSKRCSSALHHQSRAKQEELRRAYSIVPGERDVASETLVQVSFSSLWRGKGMRPEYHPLLNADACVGY